MHIHTSSLVLAKHKHFTTTMSTDPTLKHKSNVKISTSAPYSWCRINKTKKHVIKLSYNPTALLQWDLELRWVFCVRGRGFHAYPGGVQRERQRSRSPFPPQIIWGVRLNLILKPAIKSTHQAWVWHAVQEHTRTQAEGKEHKASLMVLIVSKRQGLASDFEFCLITWNQTLSSIIQKVGVFFPLIRVWL